MNLDEIGPWSEIKLDILRDYAAPYSTILKSNGFHHGYIDAFSGPGLHIRKVGGEEVLGSPLVALAVKPPFHEYHFIVLDGEKVDFLRGQVGSRPDVTFYTADSNQVMLKSVLPRFSYAKRTRAPSSGTMPSARDSSITSSSSESFSTTMKTRRPRRSPISAKRIYSRSL